MRDPGVPVKIVLVPDTGVVSACGGYVLHSGLPGISCHRKSISASEHVYF